MRDNPLTRFLGAARMLPLWLRWLLTILFYALAILAIVIVVHDVNQSSGTSSSNAEEAKAVAEADSEGKVAISEDEAPHEGRLRARVPARAALERAIAADVRARIEHGELTGPLQSVHCDASGAPRAGRLPLRCTVTSAGISYLFLGVADERALSLTWCKVDPPPEAGAQLEVPVSPRCRA